MLDFVASTNRRSALKLMFAAPASVALMGATAAIAADPDPSGSVSALTLDGSSVSLSAFAEKLAVIPRRRNFTSVPFMVDRPEFWDHEASDALLSFKGSALQVWDITDLAGPWINLMREAMNGQVFAHGNSDYLSVGAVHGAAHLALFNQDMWNKYALSEATNGQFSHNSLIVEKAGTSPADDHQNLDGFYGPNNNNIVSLQRRGAVFVACHDSVHAIARGLATKKVGSGQSADQIAADLTNNLIPGVVLVPVRLLEFVDRLSAAMFSSVAAEAFMILAIAVFARSEFTAYRLVSARS